MRLMLLFLVLPLAAGANGGCSASNQNFGGGPGREASPRLGDGSAKDGIVGEPKGAPGDSAKSADAPKKGGEPPTTPVMDTAHTGVEKRAPREPEAPSNVLTAGSFDDNVYPTYFQKFVGKAGQNPHLGGISDKLLGRRVEITVKNGQGQPVANARVRLSSPTGGKTVSLVTRSDGRAVFLTSLDLDDSDGLTVTASAGGGQPTVATLPPGAEGSTIILPAAAAPLPRNLDLAIVLDTTGSMGDELNFLKSEVRSITEAVRGRFPNVNQRYALVCYRDENKGDEYVTRKFDFTENIDEFRRNLAAQRAAGGGDIPEAVHKGLGDAVNLQWREVDTARVVFFVADAPPHGRDAPETLAKIDALRKKGIAVYPVFASGNDKDAAEATEVVMRAAAMLTGGQYIFLTDDSGVGDQHGEPHIPYYHVEKLNGLMVRMIAGELSGKRLDPERKDIIRTVGQPPRRARQD